MKFRRVGLLLMATAVLHIVVGVFYFKVPFLAIIQDGVVNAVSPNQMQPNFDREAVFWFLLVGVLFFMLGHLAQWAQQKTGVLPDALGWWLLGMSIVGVVMMPASGFWLILPQAAYILYLNHAARRMLPQ
jgi:glucan phosphoethanolaminetransferase (alkaline phosphatase superfamily)